MWPSTPCIAATTATAMMAVVVVDDLLVAVIMLMMDGDDLDIPGRVYDDRIEKDHATTVVLLLLIRQ